MNGRPSYDSAWRKRLNALTDAWPQLLAGETEALHKARVASRRIREALPVVAASAPPAKVKKLRRKVRSLTRSLGPIREADVELHTLEEQAAELGVPRRTLNVIRRDVASRRYALREKLDREQPLVDLKKLLKKLERVACATTGSGRGAARREQAWRSALATALMRRSRRLKAALDEAGPLYAPERIHDVRVAAKKLRYALEISSEIGEPRARVLVKMLKHEQTRLGRLHDLQALLRRVRDAEASPGMGTRLADLTAFADSLERQCRALHAQFVEQSSGLYDVVKEVRQAIVPDLTSARLRQAHVSTSRPRARAAKRA
jgi:CHAD domain-containing protein